MTSRNTTSRKLDLECTMPNIKIHLVKRLGENSLSEFGIVNNFSKSIGCYKKPATVITFTFHVRQKRSMMSILVLLTGKHALDTLECLVLCKRQLWATMWVLGTEPRLSARATGTLNYWAISLALDSQFLIFYITIIVIVVVVETGFLSIARIKGVHHL